MADTLVSDIKRVLEDLRRLHRQCSRTAGRGAETNQQEISAGLDLEEAIDALENALATMARKPVG